MICKFGDVGCGPFICATRIERAVAVSRSIERNEPHAFASGSVCDRREVAVRARRAMKSDDRCAVALTEVAPGEIPTVRKLEHLEITHRARLPDPGRLWRTPNGSSVRVFCSAEVEGGDAWAQRVADVDETVGDRG